MEKLIVPAYKKWYIIGFTIMVLTSWFSIGYHHADEHYQVLEFANYKLGHSVVSALPWEYGAKCRSALQPFLVYTVAKTLELIHLYNPFTVAFLLRLFMGLLSFWVGCRMIKIFLPQLKTEQGRKFYITSTFLLWFMPYLLVRFSAENISGIFFFLAVSFLLEEKNGNRAGGYLSLFIAGLFFGFTVFLRLQMGFAFVALFIWMLQVEKMKLNDLLFVILGGIIAAGMAVVVDFWFYGTWLLTPYTYFYVNIVQNVAAKYGVFPWWFYLAQFFEKAAPPVSILLLAFFSMGIFKHPKHLVSLIFVFFLLGHFAIGHKEFRFLYPLAIAFPVVISFGFDYLIEIKLFQKKLFRYLFSITLFINYAILAYKTVTPAQEMIAYFHYLYNTFKQEPCTLVAFHKSPYNFDGVELNFYKPENFSCKVIENTTALDAVLSGAGNRKVLYMSPTLMPGAELTGYKVEKCFCLFPDWLLKNNVNNWQDRSYLWTVFRIFPKEEKQ